jgi:hypothetical protein
MEAGDDLLHNSPTGPVIPGLPERRLFDWLRQPTGVSEKRPHPPTPPAPTPTLPRLRGRVGVGADRVSETGRK